MQKGLALILYQVILATANDGVIYLDIERKMIDYEPRLHRRYAPTVESEVTNGHIGYFTKVRIGTPGQELSLHLDTGSADLWVPYIDPHKSSTYRLAAENKFKIAYLDQSSASGDYFEDTIEIGGVRVSNLGMGLARHSTVPYGLAGIGYHHNVALQTWGNIYDNLPVRMKKLGLINTVAYSLWLNNLDAKGGSLLFGGIDTEKYVGELKVVPVLKNALGKYDYFGVAMAGISAVRKSHDVALPCRECSIRAVLDSGATLSFLPDDLAHAIWQEAGVKWSSNLKAPMLPCSRAGGTQKFAFHFGTEEGPTIEVGIDELVIDSTKWPSASGKPLIGGEESPWKGQRLCQFGIRNQTQPPYILGDSFLRSAYLVHDLVNHEVGMAETLFNATQSGIVPFPSHGARIPVDSSIASSGSALVSIDIGGDNEIV
ncbi:hypothetical protein ACHAQH_006333 [Verticillium albo-atrum]